MHASTSSPPAPESDKPILVFGEVLFDVFPDGRKVLGGAPYNVAVHLSALGLPTLFISRVGDDAMGQAILEAMARRGMDTSCVSVDPDHSTGAVDVVFEDGEPSYDIVQDVAWDHITLPRKLEGSILYHGSLATRSPVSASSLMAIAEHHDRFVDLNLRPPWYSAPHVLELIRETSTLKLNRSELATACSFLELPEAPLPRAARMLVNETGVSTLLVTDGGNGASVTSSSGFHFHVPAMPVDSPADTVGAGDAFSAVCLAGQMLGWPLPNTLARASTLASAICSIQGAIPDDTDFHTPYLQQWSLKQ